MSDPKTELPEITWTAVVDAKGYRVHFERRRLFQTKPATMSLMERARYWLGDLFEELSWRLRKGI